MIDAAEPTDADTVDGDDDLFGKLKRWVVEGQRHWADWDKEAREAYDLVAGKQFSDTDRDKMLDDGRQPVTFNRAGPIIDAICGLEVNGRQEVKYMPRTQGAAAVDEMLTGLAKWARDESMAEDEESDAFRDAVISGIGCTDTRMDYECNPEGEIAIDRVDPLEAKPDPAARKANAVDRRYAYRIRMLPTDTALAMFPGHDATEINATWASKAWTEDGGDGNKVDYPDETRPGMADVLSRPKECAVVEIEWFDTVPVTMIAVEGEAEPLTMGREEAKAACERLSAAGLPYTTANAKQRVYKRAVLGSAGVIETTEREGFRLHFITGKRDRNKRVWYAMGRPMRDPQMLANKVLSQILVILNSNAKGGIMYEEGAFSNKRQAMKDWSNPAKSIPLADGGLNKIKERMAPQMPAVLSALLEMAISAIPDVTGVNVEMMGTADRDQPASLEYQRRQSAVTILAPLFDALRRYRKEQGLALLELLRKLTPGTMVRITMGPPQMPPPMAMQAPVAPQGKPQQTYQPFDPSMFHLDDDTVKFDVIVDQAPSSPNQKEATWATITQLASQGVPIPPAIWAELVKYSPLPVSVAEKISEVMAAPQGQIPPEVQQMIEQGKQHIADLSNQLGQATREMQAMKADRSLDAQKLQVDGYKAETERMKAQADAETAAADAAKPREAADPLALHKIERDAAVQLEIARIRAEAAIEVARISAGQKMAGAFVDADLQRDLAVAAAPETEEVA